MAMIGEMARISVTPTETTKQKKYTLPPRWVSYAKELIERDNGNSKIPTAKAREAVKLIQDGFRQAGKEPYTEEHILDSLVNYGYFGNIDREDLLLSTFPPANPRRLREAREDMGMSIQELGSHLKEAGVTPYTGRILSCYEQGVYPLRGELLERISKFLGKRPSTLTEMTEEERHELESLRNRTVNPEQLKKKRKEKNLTAKDVATVMGLHENTYESYETGRSTPKGYHIKILCNILDTTPEELTLPLEKQDVAEEQLPTIQKQWKEHLTALMDISAHIENLEEKAATVDNIKQQLERSEKTRKAQWEMIEQQQHQIEKLLQSLR